MCTIKTIINIINLKKMLENEYSFPYYALIRITPYHGCVFHIPAPWFDGSDYVSKWAANLPIAQDRRDNEYYNCPVCGENPSFYSGICEKCLRDYDYGKIEIDFFSYANHEAVKKNMKKEFMRKLRQGIPDLGIKKAEIVLASNSNDYSDSPFYNDNSSSHDDFIEIIEKFLDKKLPSDSNEFENVMQELIIEKIKKKTNFEIPENYDEGDVIKVEGTDEERRFVNNVWQHKHPKSGFDYWHPIDRPHK